GQFHHQFPCKEFHLARAVFSGSIVTLLELAQREEMIAVGYCGTEFRVEGRVLLEEVEGVPVVTALQQLEADDDLDAGLCIFLLLEPHRVDHHLPDILKIADVCTGIEDLEGDAVDELIVGSIRYMGEGVLERGYDISEKDREVGVYFGGVAFNISVKVLFQQVQLIVDNGIRKLLLPH